MRAFGEGNPQHVSHLDGILIKRFVEVAHPKQQQRVGVLRLHLVILFHHGGFGWLQPEIK